MFARSAIGAGRSAAAESATFMIAPMSESEKVLTALPAPPADRSFEMEGRSEVIRLLVETGLSLLEDDGFTPGLHIVSPEGPEVWELHTDTRHLTFALKGAGRQRSVLHVDGAGFDGDFDPLLDRIRTECLRRFAAELRIRIPSSAP